ncbi:atrial natriuretic peptide receptor 1-like isoform X2 [Paramacrobiotus metropolitanus]|uniref:atrial natriuretic peptide receptor 1-like isoform X2 n=1 Tax=Paramacrobiotus metropolitanus TaxID=2943436 RepID=UPI002445BC98|nr:atrial natriuretic peptide receptor 1-like isoform X2 [Paramacrobiotus metropolitanus]
MRMTVDSPPEHQGDCDYFVDGIGDNVGKFWTEDSGAEYWVMLSSACTPGITEQAAFAREWNCLFLSSAGAGSDLGNKALFPTLIRFSPNLSKEYAMCLKQLLAYYNWNHVTMLCDSDDVADIALEDATLQACNDFRTIMADLRTQSGYSMYDLLVNLTDSASRVAALKTARGYSKIILIIARMEKVRMTMISAWDLGMISEDFAYITFVPFPGDSTTRGHWGWQRNDSSDEVARQAYESLLFVSLSGLKITPLLRSLFLYVEQQASEKYNKSQVMKYQQNQRLAMASFLIARAAAQMMNETIQLGWNHSDGREIYRRMLDRQFLSFDESPVYINPNGDRSELYAVWGYTNYTEDLEEVLFYDVYRNRIFPAHNDSRWIREDTIPDSRPLCEFAVTSTDCQESDGISHTFRIFHLIKIFNFLMPILVGAITLRICLSVLIPSIAVLAALIIGCLRYRYVQSAKAQLWILSCSQMEYPSRRSPVVPPLAPTMSRSKVSFMRLASVTPSAHASVQQSEFRARNRVFYKGDAVWIKTYEYTQGQYSKLVGTEHERLCTRKLMLHQNIIQFYGVVFHSDHLEIVTEFAPKGSLEEILDAEAFSSQIDLKYSFIHDLVSGLGYIQASPLGIHGNLKATNCLIDRFLTLKLTDFGLEIITNNAKKLLPEESGEWNSLYLAPEILKQLSTKVTDKSEIYSFGILLHQILFECLPFGIKNALYKRGKEEMSSMVVQAILEKVRINQDPPFRPTVLLDTYDKNLIQMMKSCWQDDPEKRPSMHRISKFIVTIPGLDKQISYTEAVMHRLQSFADELMREVNLRTKEYKQQKRNADHILYQIIPKYIVEKLQQGEDVPPEMFDEVTVCFTAVANFAHIVSISHPLEVGTFLNATFHLLDSIIRTFNVYKVETVSDTYM